MHTNICMYIHKIFLKMLIIHYQCFLKNAGHMKLSHFTWEVISKYSIALEEAARCNQLVT